MLLNYTIAQLDIGYVHDDRALEMGHLGYLQWLGALRPDVGFVDEAKRAHRLASPFIATSPAIAVFCGLLQKAAASPLRPLDVKISMGTRRGGARGRRRAISQT